MFGRRLGAALIIVTLTVAGCGGSSGSSSGNRAASSPPNDTFGITDEAGPSLDLPAIPAGGNGSCKVDITGAVTASWTTKQNMGTLQVSQWLSANNREILSIADGDEMFILNCQSDTGAVDFITTSGTTEAQFPVAPADYVIAGGIASSQAGQLGVLVNLHDKNLWRVGDGGSFKITQFGGSKLAGTFQFTMTSDAGSANVTGSFDLSCTGDACS